MSFSTVVHWSGLMPGVHLKNLAQYPALDGAFYTLLGVDCDEPNLHLHPSADVGRCWVTEDALWVRQAGAWVDVGLNWAAASRVANGTVEKRRAFLIESALAAGGQRDLPRCSRLAPQKERDKQLRETECIPLLRFYAAHGTAAQQSRAVDRLLGGRDIADQVPLAIRRQLYAAYPNAFIPGYRQAELEQ